MREQTDVIFPDLLGLTHGKTVPNHRLEHPTHYAVTCMIQGLDLGFLETDGYSTAAGFPDMEARVDPTSVRPWTDGRQTAMAFLHHSDGSPLPFDSRRQLKGLCDRWQTAGYQAVCGFEMEFFLLESLVPLRRLEVPGHRVYGIGASADPSGALERLVELAERADLGVLGMNSEFVPAQVEVSLEHGPALESADRALFFRELTRIVTRAQGIDSTYMARPFGDAVGNGLHANLSLLMPDGRNAFYDSSDIDGISPLARHFVAGLLHHHEALAAFAAPTTNSYKRLVPGMLSGYYATWGLDNRTATVRIPGQRGAATRVEHRMADGTASPHLLLAALLAAGLHGVQDELPLPGPQVGDGDALPATGRHTGHGLAESLDALMADKELLDFLDPRLVEVYVELKRREHRRWLEAVTDWEQREYSRVY